MKGYVFPGQGAQFIGMGKDLYDGSSLAKELFEQANDILGFSITDKMFNGEEDDLKQTSITQPAIFLHSVILSKALGITTAHTGMSLIANDAPIWIEDVDGTIEEKNIIARPRVGVSYAEECALWNWRFRIKDSKWTSPAK